MGDEYINVFTFVIIQNLHFDSLSRLLKERPDLRKCFYQLIINLGAFYYLTSDWIHLTPEDPSEIHKQEVGRRLDKFVVGAFSIPFVLFAFLPFHLRRKYDPHSCGWAVWGVWAWSCHLSFLTNPLYCEAYAGPNQIVQRYAVAICFSMVAYCWNLPSMRGSLGWMFLVAIVPLSSAVLGHVVEDRLQATYPLSRPRLYCYGYGMVATLHHVCIGSVLFMCRRNRCDREEQDATKYQEKSDLINA